MMNRQAKARKSSRPEGSGVRGGGGGGWWTRRPQWEPWWGAVFHTGCLGLMEKKNICSLYIFFCQKKQDGNTVEFGDMLYIYMYISKVFFPEVG